MIDCPLPGFSGLNPEVPVTIYRRHLPHWRQEGATYFVTFRLADSLPRERIEQLKHERECWERANPEPAANATEEFWRQRLAKIETWLDQGSGECLLANNRAAEIVVGAMQHFDGERYNLFARIVMPNHCHVVLRPFSNHSLERVLESWKKFSARRINAIHGRKGAVWQDEYFDRIVRDTPHLRRVMRYLQKNAGQTNGRREAWVTPGWRGWLDPEEADASGEASPGGGDIVKDDGSGDPSPVGGGIAKEDGSGEPSSVGEESRTALLSRLISSPGGQP